MDPGSQLTQMAQTVVGMTCGAYESEDGSLRLPPVQDKYKALLNSIVENLEKNVYRYDNNQIADLPPSICEDLELEMLSHLLPLPPFPQRLPLSSEGPIDLDTITSFFRATINVMSAIPTRIRIHIIDVLRRVITFVSNRLDRDKYFESIEAHWWLFHSIGLLTEMPSLSVDHAPMTTLVNFLQHSAPRLSCQQCDHRHVYKHTDSGHMLLFDDQTGSVNIIEGRNICEHRERCGRDGVILKCFPSQEDNRCPGLCGAMNLCQECQRCHLKDCDREEWMNRYGVSEDFVDEELDWHELVNEEELFD